MRDASLYRALGEQIRLVRQKRHLTQEELAARVEISRASITNIERGRQSVLVDQLYRLARALDVAPESLLPISAQLTEAKPPAKVSPALKAWVQRLKGNAP